MDALPWYRSPVFISVLVSIVTQTTVVLGVADSVTTDDIAKFVDLGLQIVALSAAGYAAYKRKRSDIQPLTLTKGGAEKQNATGEPTS
jgi:hypothetical protein